jgi:hypothetical protein
MLPTNYPDAPPMVKLCTTGGGRVRLVPLFRSYQYSRSCVDLFCCLFATDSILTSMQMEKFVSLCLGPGPARAGTPRSQPCCKSLYPFRGELCGLVSQ